MSSLHFRRKRNLVGAIAAAGARDRAIPRNALYRSSTKVSAPVNRTTAKVSSLVELLRWRAFQQPEQRVYTYLTDGETEGPHLTYEALDRQARAIGALLQSYQASGQRALLLYPAGLEFIAAFFGCLYAGVIAVPLPPPNMAQPQRTLPRLRNIVNDAQPTLVLTTSSILSKVEGLFTQAPGLRNLRWLATDQPGGSAPEEWRDPEATVKTLALLQYTSGSTANPKGVVINHENLLEDSAHIARAFDIAPDAISVMWLPVFHDMGLTNGIIQPLYGGGHCVLMPPQSFLQRPARWLQAISKYKATISGGPNFAYEMCARKVTPEQREGLDLGSWTLAYNGAEPVRADTLKRFAATFSSCGFRPSSFYPCYGLAEATLLVSGGLVKDEPILRTMKVSTLEHNHNGVVEASDNRVNVRTLVGCGHAVADTRIVIVNPESLTACAPDEVGEIWVSAPSVAKGYWNRPEETALIFHAYLADTGEGPFLRTGDLGFLGDGELFVTGRLKDLIIIGGRNLYPQEIELTVQQSHPAVRPACCAAFSVEVADEERLIVAAEVEPRYASNRHATNGNGNGNGNGTSHAHTNGHLPLDVDALVRAIRRAVAEEHDVRVHAVLLLRAGSIPMTSSGKLQRSACQAGFLDGTLTSL
jgi:acyl-CoA synthetase (AMP-forming)/AMP-acid ligase II